jgi:hypothetical protein
MQARDIMASRMGGDEFRFDLVKRERGGIDHARAGWAMRQQLL